MTATSRGAPVPLGAWIAAQAASAACACTVLLTTAQTFSSAQRKVSNDAAAKLRQQHADGMHSPGMCSVATVSTFSSIIGFTQTARLDCQPCWGPPLGVCCQDAPAAASQPELHLRCGRASTSLHQRALFSTSAGSRRHAAAPPHLRPRHQQTLTLRPMSLRRSRRCHSFQPSENATSESSAAWRRISGGKPASSWGKDSR